MPTRICRVHPVSVLDDGRVVGVDLQLELLELLPGNDRLDKDNISLLALNGAVDVTVHSDGAVVTRHLYLLVGVAGPRYELGKGESREDRVA